VTKRGNAFQRNPQRAARRIDGYARRTRRRRRTARRKERHIGLGMSRSGLACFLSRMSRLYSTLLSVTAGRILCKGDITNAEREVSTSTMMLAPCTCSHIHNDLPSLLANSVWPVRRLRRAVLGAPDCAYQDVFMHIKMWRDGDEGWKIVA